MPRALRAIVQVNTAIFDAPVVSCVPGRLTVAFEGRYPPVFAVGALVRLHLKGVHLLADVHCDAQIVQRTELEDGRAYTLNFPRHCLREDQIDSSYAERRGWMRVTPASIEKVPILLTPISPSGRNRRDLEQFGRLVDVSAGGLGVELDGPHPDHLAGHERVQVEFEPPGTNAFLERRCRIRRRSLYETLRTTRLRMGLAFDEPTPRLEFEPLWDCRRCGETKLLGQSQRRCCRCGNPRTGNTYLPEWDELIATVSHRYTGHGNSCTACGSHWSSRARCCGLCGALLTREAWVEAAPRHA